MPDKGGLGNHKGRTDKHGNPGHTGQALRKPVGADEDEFVSLQEEEKNNIDNEQIERHEEDNWFGSSPYKRSVYGYCQTLPQIEGSHFHGPLKCCLPVYLLSADAFQFNRRS